MKNLPHQTTHQLLMIRPAGFHFNPQTAKSNGYMTASHLDDHEQQYFALQEFDRLANHLTREGITLEIIEDTPTPETPDSIFPNNWLSTHDTEERTLITYPMEAKNRRLERRVDIIEKLQQQYQYAVHQDLSAYESKSQFLEGTGSLVFDRENYLAYACLSSRTHQAPLADFCKRIGFKSLTFTGVQASKQPIYHTNVMMALGPEFVAISMDVIPDTNEQHQLLENFEQTGKTVLELSESQINAFAGNMLAINNRQGDPFIALSESAWQSLDTSQRRLLEQKGTPLASPIPTIEKHAGGSVRCMLAELF
ncbi:MAG: arginine deiminase-related protein [Pseudomonadota bacterium]